MITEKDGLFCLYTNNTALFLRRSAHGHIELVHYGTLADGADADAISVKRTTPYGTAVEYSAEDPLYCLDTVPLVWSGAGRGDYRESPGEVESAAGGVSDFRYSWHEVREGAVHPEIMPDARGGDETLVLALSDEASGLELILYYTVFRSTDVITCRTALSNRSDGTVRVRKLMSGMLDLPGEYRMTTFSGGWISETHRSDTPVGAARVVVESLTGMSSNRINPGFLLSEPDTTQSHGRVYGFNLIWSGNHYASAQRSRQGITRVMQGISPSGFCRTLAPGETFETPQMVMSFSADGFNGLSAHMHDFVNLHIVPEYWSMRERPILYNSWEGCGFSVSEFRLAELGRKASKLGCELFVLDDGWFGKRNDDKAGLGDYAVNRKKLPWGLRSLSRRMEKLGMKFGLWFEPEAVNPDSDLYREHPDWALTEPGRKPVFGRNELLLDLTRPEVRDYIVDSVSSVLDSAEISYVKWDMNRHSTAIGEKAYDYILGLYDVLRRIFGPRPQILLETCASGGNRFDLGMLCFGPQIWASDDTDPIERLDIQEGLSYLYPLSCIGAHVSASPHQQTLRRTPLSTRANVSFFGLLGYELDLKYISSVDEKDIAEQIAFYKKYRSLFQFGRFRRLRAPEGETRWQVGEGAMAITGVFYRLMHAAPAADELRFCAMERDGRFTVTMRRQNLRVGDFGELTRHVMPVRLHPKGIVMNTADKLYTMADCAETLEASGAALMSGVRLNNRFCGTGYNDKIRMAGDFGSYLYVAEKTVTKRLPGHEEPAVLPDETASGETAQNEPSEEAVPSVEADGTVTEREEAALEETEQEMPDGENE